MMQKLVDRTVRKLIVTLPVNDFAQLGEKWSDMLMVEYFKCATDPFNINEKCM